MDHHSLEEHAMRLQAEAMAKLQYLQCLLQTPAPPSMIDPSTSNNNLNGLADAAATAKFLSSLSQLEASCLPPSSDFGSLPSRSLHENYFQFSHLPELQNDCSFQTTPTKEYSDIVQAPAPEFTVFGQGEDSLNSSQLAANGAPISNKPGDSCSSLSYDAPSCWPDILLDDSLF